jgi:hypothetical protein
LIYCFFIAAEEVSLQTKVAAASLLGKLVGQPMHGPRVAITVARFLPDGLVSAIRDGPGDAVVAALEQSSETPELVWSPAMAASLGAQLATMAADLYREQTKGKVVEWDLPEHSSGQQDIGDEPQVSTLADVPVTLSVRYFCHQFCLFSLLCPWFFLSLAGLYFVHISHLGF